MRGEASLAGRMQVADHHGSRCREVRLAATTVLYKVLMLMLVSSCHRVMLLSRPVRFLETHYSVQQV